jgi:hypothetical protein
LGERVPAQRTHGFLHALFFKALKNSFPQLVLHPILVDEFPDLADQSEAERNVAETGDEPDEGFWMTQEPFHLANRFLRFLYKNLFYPLGINVIRNRAGISSAIGFSGR